jgi:ferredoxin
MRHSISVNPIACAAYGYCAELLPERVTLDEWGYPVVDGTALPEHLLAVARRAANACPRRALHLTRAPDAPAAPS